ncbi:dipeptidase [Saccharopolyspora subtropica]|uniref:Dipeptidase n=1 Tax=Saccharopolyspora thermophila TaxID=89367 RepID=A0A917NAT7_9PSEU|nr:M20/M25/M40 family metallo-hydrolase [Saccharopolyspora subtropica]GGI84430.1 dipeptidase [Saccharopolyspora subtropica]
MDVESSTSNVEDLKQKVAQLQGDLKKDLISLVRIRSHLGAEKKKAADKVVSLLSEAGVHNAQTISLGNSAPLVHGSITVDPIKPTVLLYAHYDVQPPGSWSEDEAFDPKEKNGRLYGRGAADDKSGIMMHVGMLRAFGTKPPVNVEFLIEGEEESGTGSLEEYLDRPENQDRFVADAYVIADTGGVAVGSPALTTSLRGIAQADITVRTLEGPVHSGMYGGPAPDAFMALCRILATLHDDAGDVAIPGLLATKWTGADYPDATTFCHNAGVLPGVPLIGTKSVAQRLYTKPSLNVVGLDSDLPTTKDSVNALCPQATARVSIRLVPGQEPAAAVAALREHINRNRPWFLSVDVVDRGGGSGFEVKTGSKIYAMAEWALKTAYGRAVTSLGQGGSIPLVHKLQARNENAPVLLWGCEEPAARIHAPNESVDLGELERMTLAEALFLDELSKL